MVSFSIVFTCVGTKSMLNNCTPKKGAPGRAEEQSMRELTKKKGTGKIATKKDNGSGVEKEEETVKMGLYEDMGTKYWVQLDTTG